MKQQIVIIPGFDGDARHPTSRKFKKIFEKKCYIFVPTWKYHALNHWLEEFENFLAKNKIKNPIIFGFSMGAYILACSDVKARKVIYGSMTPLFKPFTNNMPKSVKKFFGKKRLAQMGKYQEKPNSVFIIGEKETLAMHQAVKKFAKKAIVIKGADHDLANPNYFKAVVEEIKRP